MRKDRNCGAPYPMYPNQGMMPPMQQPMPFPMQQPMPYPMCPNQGGQINPVEQQLVLMQQQINNLDKRVTKLETMANGQNNMGNQFNDNNSNYHMM